MIKKIQKDQFLKNNVIFFIGSMIAAGLNYVYHPIMSRMMSVEDFGELETLISLTYITGIFLAICGTVSINIVANKKEKLHGECNQVLSQIFALVLPIVVFGAFLTIAVSPLLRDFLQFRSIVPFLPFALILLVDIVSTFYGAYLRGIKDFYAVSISNIISSFARIVFGVIFVYIGWRVFGGIAALALATLASIFYMMHVARGKFALLLNQKAVLSHDLKKEMRYAILVLFGLAYITFLYASDVIFIKHFFSPEIAGEYSGIATIARIIFFATASVSGVLMPSVYLKARSGENRKVLKKALIINMCIGAGFLALFYIMPTWITTIMIGESYRSVAHILPIVGLYALLVSFVNIFYTYLIALRDKSIVPVSLVSIGMIMILMMFFHGSVLDIVYNYICGIIVTIGLLFVFRFRIR